MKRKSRQKKKTPHRGQMIYLLKGIEANLFKAIDTYKSLLSKEELAKAGDALQEIDKLNVMLGNK